MTLLVRIQTLIAFGVLFLISIFNHAVANNLLPKDDSVAFTNEIKPALWKVEHQGTTSYLLGSIHIGKKQWYPLPNYLMDAFEKSKTIVVELDAIKHSGIMTQQMMLPIDETLKDSLSNETYNKLGSYLSVNGMSINAFNQFRPWAVATVLAVLPYLKAGLDPKFGIDGQFITLAKKNSMDVIELETPQFQIDLLSDLFSDEKMLMELIGQPAIESQQLVDFWSAGKTNEINHLVEQQMTPSQRELMLTSRNVNWVKQLTLLFNAKTSYFVVVGAGHLVGNNGVPALLMKNGIKVQRVK